MIFKREQINKCHTPTGMIDILSGFKYFFIFIIMIFFIAPGFLRGEEYSRWPLSPESGLIKNNSIFPSIVMKGEIFTSAPITIGNRKGKEKKFPQIIFDNCEIDSITFINCSFDTLSFYACKINNIILEKCDSIWGFHFNNCELIDQIKMDSCSTTPTDSCSFTGINVYSPSNWKRGYLGEEKILLTRNFLDDIDFSNCSVGHIFIEDKKQNYYSGEPTEIYFSGNFKTIEMSHLDPLDYVEFGIATCNQISFDTMSHINQKDEYPYLTSNLKLTGLTVDTLKMRGDFFTESSKPDLEGFEYRNLQFFNKKSNDYEMNITRTRIETASDMFGPDWDGVRNLFWKSNYSSSAYKTLYEKLLNLGKNKLADQIYIDWQFRAVKDSQWYSINKIKTELLFLIAGFGRLSLSCIPFLWILGLFFLGYILFRPERMFRKGLNKGLGKCLLFSPFWHCMDLIVPGMDLHSESEWQPKKRYLE